jgi:hypothetical protein
VTGVAPLWDRLDTDGEADAGYVRLRIPFITVVSAYAARRIGSGLEALVLELPTSEIPPAVDFPASAAFSVEPVPLTPGRNGRTRYVLSLDDGLFGDVFRTLVEDLVEEIAAATSASGVITAMSFQLHRWQAFLRAVGTAGLSPEQRRGLVGELLFLRDELLPRLGDAGVQAWSGWDAANHDVQLPGSSIEIKSTSANTPHAVQISNIRQLDESTSPALHLCLTLLDESANHGESLPGIVASLRSAISPAERSRLDDRLFTAGYVPGDADRYPLPRYTMRERRLYHVLEGFPRLLSESLPDGVEEVRYSIALAACASFRVDLSTALDVIASRE